ncbi:MAG: hypothetical protein QOI78_7601 [Actinomycetota bacterium]|nr:hypothetical protein [Actinomycetota bacterium]
MSPRRPRPSGPRFDLWWKLVGAYTGEVLVRAYGGDWTTHTAFPFGVAERVLSGEPFKSLASFGRALPAIIERTEPRD